MRTRDTSSHKHLGPTAGFTLLELMIVVSVMVLLVAIVTPSIVSMRREAWIGEQADEVRELMSRSRQFAVDQGIDYTFHYELGGNHAVVLPAENEEDSSEATNESGQSAVAEEYDRALLELPEELKMRTPEGVEEQSESIDQTRFGSLVGNQLEDKRWSRGIKFRFDGTSEDFELRLHDDNDLSCNVTLRGLTGSVRTTQVYTEDN
ncbi:MAG: type II secretion system protein [Fuerstiella sp.]